jgi:deazaflavin-dependent oxidoreductase (nitroreductase family)
MPNSRTRTALVALELLVAVTAVGGGIALITGLENARFPFSWLSGTPFADYTGPGLVLAAVVGGSATAATTALVRQSTLAVTWALVAGMVLVGWIVGEIVLIRADNELVSPMEAFYLVVGLVTIALALRHGRTTMGQRSDSAPRPPRYVRPTIAMARLINPIVARLGGTLVLTVRGRRTGRPVRVPLGRPFDLDGVRYLVAGGGETHWVRNLRASGVGELRLHGARTAFRAVELEGPERDRIVAAYREKQGRTVEGFFRALPELADHPVFRVEPMVAAATAVTAPGSSRP